MQLGSCEAENAMLKKKGKQVWEKIKGIINLCSEMIHGRGNINLITRCFTQGYFREAAEAPDISPVIANSPFPVFFSLSMHLVYRPSFVPFQKKWGQLRTMGLAFKGTELPPGLGGSEDLLCRHYLQQQAWEASLGGKEEKRSTWSNPSSLSSIFFFFFSLF